jgi:hypothetical protein
MNIEEKLLGRRIWSRPWFIVLSVLVLIITSFLFFRLSKKSAVNKKLDEIRASGYPVTFEELDQWYSIPSDQNNAADTILDAIARFQQWPQQEMEDLPFIGTGRPPGRTETITETRKVTIAKYLADNAETLELLHQASQIEHCRFPVDYTAGFNTTIDYLGDLKKSIRLVALEASLRAQNNRPNATIDSINTAMGLVRCLDKEPLLISHMVRIACQAQALDALEYAINQIKFSDQQLNALSRAVEDAKNPDAMLYGFVGEACSGIDFLTRPTNQKLQLMGGNRSRFLYAYTATGLANQDALIYLEIMTEYVEASKLPPIERLRIVKAAAEEAEGIPKIRFLARAITPAFAHVTARDCEVMAQLDAAHVALAIERHRRATGKLPDSLDDLVPKFLDNIPTDPFDGKPLKYKNLDPGFVIYSIGADRQDDGGKERGPERKRPNDVTFIIER